MIDMNAGLLGVQRERERDTHTHTHTGLSDKLNERQ